MSSPAPASSIQVQMPDGVTVTHPAGTAMADAAAHAERYARAMMTPDPAAKPWDQTPPPQGPSEPTIRARTMWDSIGDLKDKIGRVAAAAVGLDFDKLKDMEASGHRLAMIPMEPSAASKSLMNADIAAPVTPGYMPPRGRFINSLLVDEGGNTYDLGENIHADAMAHLEPDMWKYYTGAGGANDENAMAKSLAKNKMIRVQMTPTGKDIAVEAHHAPTPHQLEALMEMFEAHPRALGSYDFTNAAGKNVFDNLVQPAALVDKIFEHFYPR